MPLNAEVAVWFVLSCSRSANNSICFISEEQDRKFRKFMVFPSFEIIFIINFLFAYKRGRRKGSA